MLCSAFAFLFLGLTLSACPDHNDDDTTYIVSFSGGTPEVKYNATISELDNQSNEVNFYDLGIIEAGYKTQKYIAHENAVKLIITATVLNDPVNFNYGFISGSTVTNVGIGLPYFLKEGEGNDFSYSLPTVTVKTSVEGSK